MAWFALDVGGGWREIRESPKRPVAKTYTINVGGTQHTMTNFIGGTTRGVVKRTYLRQVTGAPLVGKVSKLPPAKVKDLLTKL